MNFKRLALGTEAALGWAMMKCALIPLLALSALSASAEMSAELRLPDSPVVAGRPALISAVLTGVEAGKIYTLLPPAGEPAPSVSWGTLEWGALESAPELHLSLIATATEPGSYEIPSLQLRALAIEEQAPLAGETLDISKAVVVATKPFTVEVKRDWFARKILSIAGILLGVLLLGGGAAIYVLRTRKQSRAALPAGLSPQEQAREHLHAARRQRLDGDFYQFYLSLADGAKALKLDTVGKLEQRAQDVGYRGMRPSDDEMDGDFKDLERALTQRMEDK